MTWHYGALVRYTANRAVVAQQTMESLRLATMRGGAGDGYIA